MAVVEVNINGRGYPVVCREGQQERVREVARHVDATARNIARGMGSTVNDAHLLVLTSLLVADELFDMRDEQAAAKPAEDPAAVEAMESLIRRVEELAARVEGA